MDEKTKRLDHVSRSSKAPFQGSSQREIATVLGLHRNTVQRYSGMTEAGFEQFLQRKESKDKLLDPYEMFVRGRLLAAPAASAAQAHDWLKEHHADFPKVSAKTVYSFVMRIRQESQIPLEEASREFFMVEPLPCGEQAQADFGQYLLASAEKKRKKVYFFVMMLSRSRMKFVYFLDRPFTSADAVDAHEAGILFL